MPIVDDREPKTVQNVLREYFPDLVVRRIEVADVIDGNIAIERKTSLDFAASITGEKRLYSQARNMRMNYEHCYIIMVGTYEDVRNSRYHDVTVNRFIGAMADMAMLYKVPVLQCENNKQFGRYCQSLFKKADGEAPNNITKVNKWKENQELSCLLGIYGLGEKRARSILKQFSIHELCHASVDDLTTIKGIGVKYARAIKKVFK